MSRACIQQETRSEICYACPMSCVCAMCSTKWWANVRRNAGWSLRATTHTTTTKQQSRVLSIESLDAVSFPNAATQYLQEHAIRRTCASELLLTFTYSRQDKPVQIGTHSFRDAAVVTTTCWTLQDEPPKSILARCNLAPRDPWLTQAQMPPLIWHVSERSKNDEQQSAD